MRILKSRTQYIDTTQKNVRPGENPEEHDY